MPPGHKTSVTDAVRLADTQRRWKITLVCGHSTIVTSHTKPIHAHCRACSKQPDAVGTLS